LFFSHKSQLKETHRHTVVTVFLLVSRVGLTTGKLHYVPEKNMRLHFIQ